MGWLSLALGFIAKLVSYWISDRRAEANQREIGKVTAERDQAVAGVKASQSMAQEAARPVSEDDAIDRMSKGDA